MDFSFFILLGFFAYRNGMRAKQKEQNPYLWGALTVALFAIASIIGMMVVMVSILKDENLDLAKIQAKDQVYAQSLAQQVAQALENNPIHSITIIVFGLGGYLLVRYILDKKPEKKKKLDLWPDKENANNVNL